MAQEVKYLSYSGLSYFKDRVFEVINPLISENKANILSIQNFLEKPVFEEVNINTLNVIDEINLNGTRLFNFDFLPLSGGTMTGTITSQSIIPAKTHTTSDTAYSLGSSSKQFNTTYTRYVDTVSGYNLRLKAGGTEHLNMLGGTINSTANIIPTTNNTYNLGSSSLKWANVYATTFTGHLNGTVSMTAGNANAYRDILVTNGSNGICYSSSGNVQLNYATGDVKATSFTGNLIGNATSATTATKIGTYTANDIFVRQSRPDTGFNIDEIELFGMRDIQPTSEITRTGTFPFDGWGSLMSFNGSNYFVQLATQNTSAGLYFRSAYGSAVKLTDKPWVKFLDSSNYSSYALPLSGGTMTGTINSQNIIPTSNSSYNLGSSSKQWNTIYGKTIYENGTSLVDKYAQISKTFITNRDSIDNLTSSEITSYADLSTSAAGQTAFKLLKSGSYKVDRSGHTELLINLGTNTGSTSALEFLTHYIHNDRLRVRKVIDSNRVSGEFKELAWYSDIPASLKNPYSLTIQGNGTTLTNGVYDGSAAKTVNITPASIGALPLSGGTLTGTVNSQNIIPKTTNTYNLGSSSVKYANAYATTFTGNLKGSMLSSVSNSSSASITEIPNAIRFDSFLASNTTSGFGSGYNNAILTVGRFETTNYASQIGFSGNGKLYYRSFIGTPLDDSKTWSQIALTSDIPTSLTNTEIDAIFTDLGVTF